MMSQNVIKSSTSRRLVALALAGLMILSLFAGMSRAALAADPNTVASPTAGALGTEFSISGLGYAPGEKITLWTTDNTGQALDAGYIFADSQGNFSLKVDTFDPQALATTGNYTTLVATYDDNGNLTGGGYWELVLKDTPAAGAWHVTSEGTTSNLVKSYDFTISQ